MSRRPRHLPSSALKFAVFAVACLVLLVALAARIGNLSLFSSRHTFYAQLADVTGLTPGDGVDVAGVPVGQVSSVALQRSHALVGLSLDDSQVLRSNSDVGLRWLNVLGQKVVYLYPAASGRVLAPGATLPLSHDVSDASINAFLNTVGPFLSAINTTQANAFVEAVSGALQGDEVEIDQLIDQGATVSSTVGSLDTQVGQVIGSLDQVLTAIAARRGDLASLVDNLQTVAASLASHNQLLDQVVGNLSHVAGDVAGLVGNNRTTLDTTITDLDAVTQDIVAHQGELAQSLATLGSGLAPYVEISSYGQWFEVQTIYTCLANQTACSYYEPDNPSPGSGPGGGPPLPGTGGTTTTGPPSTTTTPSTTAPSTTAPSGTAGLRSIFGSVSGATP